MLEALGTEKSALVFQLERLEQQLKNAQGGQTGGPAINMSGLEGPGRRGLDEGQIVLYLVMTVFIFSAILIFKFSILQ